MCSAQHEIVGLTYIVYLNILILITFIYGVFNLRISNRFGADGRAVLSVTIMMFIGRLANQWIFSDVDPTSYLYTFYASSVYYLVFIGLTAGGVFVPLVSSSVWHAVQ